MSCRKSSSADCKTVGLGKNPRTNHLLPFYGEQNKQSGSSKYIQLGRKHGRTYFGKPAVHGLYGEVNGKYTTVSYNVHKIIENPKEEYQIIPNTQEAIIDENVWLRVQELRKNKQRNAKIGKSSLSSGLVFCADCKPKLYFYAAKSLKQNQEFFGYANYKDGRGNTIRFIRDVVPEMIMKETVADLADFV